MMPIIIMFLLSLVMPTLAFSGASFNNLGGGGVGSGSGAMENESSTVVAPGAAGITWIRVGGGGGDPAIGVDGSGNMVLDADGDLSADCTISKSGGISTIDCANTNATIQPGQTNGDIKFNDSTGTERLELDPDTGVFSFSNTLDFQGIVTSKVLHDSDTAASVALSGADCRGGIHYNNDADAITYTLCDGETGGGQFVILYAREDGNITVDVFDASESFEATGLAPSAGEALVLTAVEGDFIVVKSISATLWRVLDWKGTLAEETP